MAQVGGVLLLFAMLAAGLGRATVASASGTSPITMTPGPGNGTVGPYASGQQIKVDVAANSTLSVHNLVAAGYPSGAAVFKIYECADPGGTTAHLPTTSLQCDGQTIATYSTPNADGSFSYPNYTIYATPDRPTFQEPPDTLPICSDTPKTECVLYVGTDINSFSKPHIFSAPFFVTANASDSGRPAGNGGVVPSSGSNVAVIVLIVVAVVVIVAAGAFYLRRRRQTESL